MTHEHPHADGKTRCRWPGSDALYLAYHDEEWGVPEFDDRALFEKLVLDGFQAGLSWITILRKRENFRKAFDQFEPAKIARYKPAKLAALMQNEGIIRNRAKIEGVCRLGTGLSRAAGGRRLSAITFGISSMARRSRTSSAGTSRFPPKRRFRSKSPRI